MNATSNINATVRPTTIRARQSAFRRAYLAGPMTGCHEFNFPTFDAAAAHLRLKGWDVISPAEMDRANGFDEKGCTGKEELSDQQRHQFAANDIQAILDVDCVWVLPGWERSTGASNEVKVAHWLGKPVYKFPRGERIVADGEQFTTKTPARDLSPLSMAELKRRIDEADAARLSENGLTKLIADVTDTPPRNARADILLGAEELVNGDRNAQYGDPRQDFQRTADMWTAYLGVKIEPHDVAAMMSLLKVSRIRWSPGKQDSWMDLAGYAACGWDCASVRVA